MVVALVAVLDNVTVVDTIQVVLKLVSKRGLYPLLDKEIEPERAFKAMEKDILLGYR